MCGSNLRAVAFLPHAAYGGPTKQSGIGVEHAPRRLARIYQHPDNHQLDVSSSHGSHSQKWDASLPSSLSLPPKLGPSFGSLPWDLPGILSSFRPLVGSTETPEEILKSPRDSCSLRDQQPLHNRCNAPVLSPPAGPPILSCSPSAVFSCRPASLAKPGFSLLREGELPLQFQSLSHSPRPWPSMRLLHSTTSWVSISNGFARELPSEGKSLHTATFSIRERQELLSLPP